MMAKNCGTSTLRRKRSSTTPMRDFDRLPAELRAWTTQAVLPWRAKSVARAYRKALSRTGCHQQAIAELDQLQSRLIAKDAKRIWGTGYPLG